MTIHATCVALPDPALEGDWAGVLVRGPSGAGKSDLALRLIDGGGRLVSDDRVRLRGVGEDVLASAPSAIAGLLEVRGLGVFRAEMLKQAAVRLVIDPAPTAYEKRLPEPAFASIAGARVPVIALRYDAASAPARVRLALKAVRLGLFEAAQPRLDAASQGGEDE